LSAVMVRFDYRLPWGFTLTSPIIIDSARKLTNRINTERITDRITFGNTSRSGAIERLFESIVDR